MRLYNGILKLETVYDWVTVGIFVGLAVLFLQRSSEEVPRDKIYHYFPPALGCAVANYVGNEGYMVPAVLVITGVLAYMVYFLEPFGQSGDRSN